MSTFTNTVRKLTVDECARQKRTHDAKKADDIERLGFFSNSMSSISLWRIAGSAGRAVTWLEQLDAEHPDAHPHDLVEQLEMRIEDEISAHPRTFTIKHLHGVLEYARQTADEQLVDNLMEALGITPQPWQHTYLEHMTISRPAFDPGGPTSAAFLEGVEAGRAALAGPTFAQVSSPFIDEAPPIRPTWWRRTGTAIATWWLDTWHSIANITPEAMLAMLLLGVAFVIILALLAPSGAK